MATRLFKASLLVRTIFFPFTSPHSQSSNQKRIKRRRRKSPNQRHRFQSSSFQFHRRLWNWWAKTRERFKIAFKDFIMDWCLWSLIDDAKENPNDSANPPVEPNLHSAESVIKQFRERETAVDCRDVIEYLRALVTTNAISEYLPDKESGKPCTLHTLLQELEQCASCNTDESFLSPGISEPIMNVKTFKDVKGCDDAKQELEEVVEYLRNPAKFTRLGVKLPKGILLTGRPGTGKTLLAKAFAGEAGLPFFYQAGSEFGDMYSGVGAQSVRTLFEAARNKAPCIIFIDEVDGVGSSNQALHQLLVEMDGFEQNEGIIVLAATNLPRCLDPALTRPGRFDRHIIVRHPDICGRQEILELYLQDKPLADDVDITSIACGTPGFNGADLANLVNIAATQAAVEGSEKLAAAQLEFAKDRIIMGTEQKTMFISEESKKVTAYHESGHAVVAINTVGANPIYKATIRPHGSALGMVVEIPSCDQKPMSKQQLLARLDVCMGGRVAEEIIFGQDHITAGASSDLYMATKTAKYMVTICGMSDAIGPLYIQQPPSYAMQSRIDEEVDKLLREAYDRVKALLKKHEKALHALADALLFYETLNAEEIRRILLPYQQEQQKQETTIAELVPA